MLDVAQDGHITGSDGNTQPSGGSSPTTPGPEDVQLAAVMRTYDQLGEAPPVVNLAQNDRDYENAGAHTIKRHGHQVPLRRDPNVLTIEGRIYKDTGWGKRSNQSFRWDSEKTMTDEVNGYIHRNWDAIRSDLALGQSHRGEYDAGHRIGEGFFNGSMDTPDPPQAQYMMTSRMRIVVDKVLGSDPAQSFVISAYPVGILR